MVVSTELKVVDSISLDETLSNTGYSIKWIITMLHENNPKFVEALGNSRVKNISAKDISEAKGYLSRVFRVVIEFEDPNLKEYSFIMKVPTMDCLDEIFKSMELFDDSKDKFMKQLEEAHKKECEAYQLIKNIKNFPKAETYYVEYTPIGQKGNGPGVIVMEDLSDKATTIGLFRSVTAQHCFNVARHFGNFQVQINSTDGWKGKYPDSFHTGPATTDETPKFMEKVVENYKYFEEPVKQLMTIDLLKFSLYGLKELPKKYNAITLCQGDCWSNNILMSKGTDGSVMDQIAAIIDWQIIFESKSFNSKFQIVFIANPMLDLARFMTLCADAEIRRECEEKAINLQYDTLCEEYKKIGETAPYTREQAHELYDYAYIHQAYALVGMACFTKLYNIEKVSEHIKNAQAEKVALRAHLGLEDALERMKKHNIFERFQKQAN